jgi:hypothetical protein
MKLTSKTKAKILIVIVAMSTAACAGYWEINRVPDYANTRMKFSGPPPPPPQVQVVPSYAYEDRLYSRPVPPEPVYRRGNRGCDFCDFP